MQMIFRDKDFPEIEIRNNGRCGFHIHEIETGKEIDMFTVYENDSYEITAQFAYDKACEHFAEMKG